MQLSTTVRNDRIRRRAHVLVFAHSHMRVCTLSTVRVHASAADVGLIPNNAGQMGERFTQDILNSHARDSSTVLQSPKFNLR